MHKPIENHIRVSDGYEHVSISDVPKFKKQLSDEARVMINQVLGTPRIEYEVSGENKILHTIPGRREFGVWPRGAQALHLQKMVDEEVLAPHEAEAVMEAIIDMDGADTILMNPASPVTQGGEGTETNDKEAA